jgi:nucleoside-diphosphate-sugar epimerase
VQRFLFTSSACVYPGYRQNLPDVVPLKEEDAYPADAEDGYGWEKLFSERMCRHYHEDHGLATYVVRLHNVYGPLGTYDGGREKAPAAICRKLALARNGDEIEVWGDGKQTRSYCYVDDCLEGMYRLMQTEEHAPVNVGSTRLVTVDELIDIVAGISGKTVHKRYDLTKPQGVRGRNSDNTRLRSILGWEPQTTLEDGLARTYRWIHDQLLKAGRVHEEVLR